MNFDANLMVRQVRERLEQGLTARHRHMLEQVITHLKGEVNFDLDQLMSAYPTAQPSYRIWEDGDDVGPKGRAAIRAWYGVRGLMEEKYTLENVFEFNRLLHLILRILCLSITYA